MLGASAARADLHGLGAAVAARVRLQVALRCGGRFRGLSGALASLLSRFGSNWSAWLTVAVLVSGSGLSTRARRMSVAWAGPVSAAALAASTSYSMVFVTLAIFLIIGSLTAMTPAKDKQTHL